MFLHWFYPFPLSELYLLNSSQSLFLYTNWALIFLFSWEMDYQNVRDEGLYLIRNGDNINLAFLIHFFL